MEGKFEREARVIVNAFVDQIHEALISGNDVVLNNFGIFVLEDTPLRMIVSHLPGFFKTSTILHRLRS
jgi:bacterial DNA-binding protein